MRTITKALITLMAAITMCLMPLSIMDDAEAATISTGDGGASIEAEDVGMENFNRLVSDIDRDQILYGLDLEVETTDIEIKEVKSLKRSIGYKVNSGDSKYVYGDSYKLKISYEKSSLTEPYILFPLEDGLQSLYNYVGTNEAPIGSALKIEGDVETRTSLNVQSEFYLTDDKNVAETGTEMERTTYVWYKLTFTYTDTVNNVTKTFTVEKKDMTVDIITTAVDLLDNNRSKLAADDTVIVTVYREHNLEYGADYSFDGKSASYYEKHLSGVNGTFQKDTAEMLGVLSTDDVAAQKNIPYYSDDAEISLYSSDDVRDASLKSNGAMKDFLKTIGKVGDSYETAESIQGSSAAVIGTVEGTSDVIFFVIIGVLAAATVAMGILLLKKD